MIMDRLGQILVGLFGHHDNIMALLNGNASRLLCPICLVGFINQFLFLLSFIGRRLLMLANVSF